ncbi:hypothetical protein BC830DRAFT_68456 [Chytriomyces sp. MP71]|nr:hypothetical protein BC830DRAFT_68456 [Chytriomyces sp. MP71]
MAGGYIEGDVWYYSDGTRSPFQSVADCFWLLIVTMTTVGYGDVVPITLQGKLVMSSVMILSLFIIAFPLCMITMQYSQCARDFADEKATHAKTAKRLRARFQRARLERLQSLIVEGAETGRRKKPPISMMRSKSAGNLMVGIK